MTIFVIVIAAKEHLYVFESMAQDPNIPRHAL